MEEVKSVNSQPLQIKVSRGPGGRYDFEVSLLGLDPIDTIEKIKLLVEKLNLEYPFFTGEEK